MSSGFNTEGLMLARNLIAVLIPCVCLCAPARAALYEFTLDGTVYYSAWPNVSVGDPFIIRYSADSYDLHPGVTVGAYAATAAVVTLPNTTIPSDGPFTAVAVYLNILDGRNMVQYSSEDESPYTFYVRFEFPSGTLTSAALPLTLPLESAMSAMFLVNELGPEVRGSITSHSAVEVPEPSQLGLLSLFSALLHRRRLKSRLRSFKLQAIRIGQGLKEAKHGNLDSHRSTEPVRACWSIWPLCE
jgi:hypothetical protein